MAERPVFIPRISGSALVEQTRFEFGWNPGFAAAQKRKNVAALHAAAAAKGCAPLLEVSTKSDERLGQRLSAFSLKVRHGEFGDMPLECAYQGSKVFEHGGPYTDLFGVHPRDAKRDARLRESGRLIEFRFDGRHFPLTPTTVFYDWLYIGALFPHREYLKRLYAYAGFTDIEFNPAKSVNCQARSCAALVAMMQRGILEHAMQSDSNFVEVVRCADPLIVVRRSPIASASLFPIDG